MSSLNAIDRNAKRNAPRQRGGDALDNFGDERADRFAALREMFDPGTIRHLEKRGVSRGWHCLELGGAGGSIAEWLSERVGPAGRVVVTEINTQSLEGVARANLEVLHHNVVTDPLPEGVFDLVHARLLLGHLPQRDLILSRMVAALKPGGWLLDEEFEGLSFDACRDQSLGGGALRAAVAMDRVMEEQGVDLHFGRSLFERVRSIGLVDVGADAHSSMWRARSAGTCFLRSCLKQFSTAMIRGGLITAEEFQCDLTSLDDPGFATLSPTLWSVWGRRQHEVEGKEHETA